MFGAVRPFPTAEATRPSTVARNRLLGANWYDLTVLTQYASTLRIRTRTPSARAYDCPASPLFLNCFHTLGLQTTPVGETSRNGCSASSTRHMHSHNRMIIFYPEYRVGSSNRSHNMTDRWDLKLGSKLVLALQLRQCAEGNEGYSRARGSCLVPTAEYTRLAS